MKKLFSILAAVLFAGSMMATTVSKTVEELASANSWENGTVVTPFALDEVITVSTTATDANTGKYYTAGNQIRLYQTGAATITLTAAEGYTISSVKLTYASQNTGILVEAESGTAVPFENVQSATFTVGNSGAATNGQVRLTAFEVEYADGEVIPPVETFDYYVVGSMTSWGPDAAYKLVPNPAAEGEYMADFTFAANDEFKVAYSNGTTIDDANWFPTGMNNNYIVTEAGDYTIYFRPDGQGGEDWHYGYIYAALKDPIVPGELATTGVHTLTPVEADAAGAGTYEKVIDGIQLNWEGAYYATDFRMYANKTLTITAGANIVKVEIAGLAKKDLAPVVNNGEITTGASFAAETTKADIEDPLIVIENIDATSVTITCNKQLQARIIRVTLPNATAIDNNEVEMKAVKRVVNGQLFIEKNGVLYNAQGAVVR